MYDDRVREYLCFCVLCERLCVHMCLCVNLTFTRKFTRTFTLSADEQYCYGHVSKWTTGVDLFDKELILVPINIDQQHWTVSVMMISVTIE